MRTGISTLDLVLGLRMLVRFPGLTLVGGLAIAFAIWVGAGTFEFINQVINPRLPLEEGTRIVGIRNLDRTSSGTESPSLHDFAAWSGGLGTVRELGAFRVLERNLISSEGDGEPVEVAEISASAFGVARVPPLLGRPLVAADERADADPVAVIGYDVWQRRFQGDPAIIGREIRLGRSVHSVVGVMPEGFAFPVSQRLWTPLRLDPLAYPAGESPSVHVFGRLAPGASLEDAQAEIAALGERMAADSPETHEHLRPQLLPYAKSILNIPTMAALGLGSVNLFLVMLLVLVCGNVALLMFARAATRERELVVRSALGATRGRIVGQLFAEALVLAAVGAAIGLAGVELGLRWGFGALRSVIAEVPFWIRPSLSPSTIAYALLLTLLAALVAGVVPGLKVTRGLRAGLQQASAGGGGFRFGGIWTVVIVSQIAITVTFPVVAFILDGEAAEFEEVELGFPDEQYLAVRIEMDRGDAPTQSADAGGAEFQARYAAAVARLEERLAAEPAVSSAAFGERLPRMYHPHRLVELDSAGASIPDSVPATHRVSSASVAPDFFDTFRAPILVGRGFHSGDLDSEARVVIVNQSFVQNVLGGRNPIGRRIRHVYYEERDEPLAEEVAGEPWYEIVGVVRDLGLSVGWEDPKVAGFYHPVASGGAYPGHLAVEVRGDPTAFASRVRDIATRLEPELRLYDIQPLDQANTDDLQFLSFWFRLTTAISGVAMFLALAGIYAVMSFTVSQRTREIGIRVALGGTSSGVVRAVFRRPLRQIGLGVLLGTLLSTALISAGDLGGMTPGVVALIVAYAAGMAAVCLLACIVPTRRALGVEPTEALRAEG